MSWKRALGRLVPNFYYRHRGFALASLGLVLWNFISAVDCLFFTAPPRHSGPIWAPMMALAPLWIWGLAHAVVGAMIVAGAYFDHDDLRLARQAFAVNVSLAVFRGGAVVYALVTLSNTPVYSLAPIALVVLVSWAGLTEPGIQIAHRSLSEDGIR